jgi:type III pantothenate kinase
MPGLGLMRDSLFEHTNIKVNDEMEGDVSLLARDTGDAIAGGTLYTMIAVIDRVVADVSAELAINITRVLTGGDAHKLLPLLSGEYSHVPDLVLRGLAVIAEEAA